MKNTFKIQEIRYMSKGGGMTRVLDKERRKNGAGNKIAQGSEEGGEGCWTINGREYDRMMLRWYLQEYIVSEGR